MHFKFSFLALWLTSGSGCVLLPGGTRIPHDRTWGFSTRGNPNPIPMQSGCKNSYGMRRHSHMTLGAFGPWWAIFGQFLVVVQYYLYVLSILFISCDFVFLAGLRAPSFHKLGVCRDAGAMAGVHQARWRAKDLVSCFFLFLYIYIGLQPLYSILLFFFFLVLKPSCRDTPLLSGSSPKTGTSSWYGSRNAIWSARCRACTIIGPW